MDFSRPWYHGSPAVLSSLAPGSTITQDRNLARVFSHKPPLVSQWVDEHSQRRFKHSGRQPGYLYHIVEDVTPQDVYAHPRTTMDPEQEWLTRRALRIELLESTRPKAEEVLSTEEVETLRQHRLETTE